MRNIPVDITSKYRWSGDDASRISFFPFFSTHCFDRINRRTKTETGKGRGFEDSQRARGEIRAPYSVISSASRIQIKRNTYVSSCPWFRVIQMQATTGWPRIQYRIWNIDMRMCDPHASLPLLHLSCRITRTRRVNDADWPPLSWRSMTVRKGTITQEAQIARALTRRHHHWPMISRNRIRRGRCCVLTQTERSRGKFLPTFVQV